MPARCRLKQFIWKKYATRSKLLPPIDTLLYDALLDLKLDVAWWAIKKGASSTRWNNMPLRMAIECKDGCFVNYLVTEKHVPNSILEIRHAIETSNLEIVKCLLNNASAKTQNRIDNDFYLGFAASHGNTDVVSYFMSKGGDIDAFDGEALRAACSGGFIETVKLLLDVGADPRVCEGECLIRTCRRGYLEIVQLLIDMGMDPNPGLLPAIRGRHTETVQLLLEYGATRGTEHEEAIKALSTKEKRDMMLI